MKARVKRVEIAKKLIQKHITNECDKARNIGIAAGAKTMAAVIKDIIKDEYLDIDVKITKINNFCDTCLSNPISSDLKTKEKDGTIAEQENE